MTDKAKKQLQAQLEAALLRIEGLEFQVKDLKEIRDAMADGILRMNGLRD